MAAQKQSQEVSPERFLRFAKAYLKAAEDLYGVQGIDIGAVQEPLYFLYAHSIELALKTRLRVLGISTRDLSSRKFGHSLTTLLKENAGLTDGWDNDNQLSIRNVVDLLERGNVDQGLRYYTTESQYLPSLPWTQTVARKAVDAADRAVHDHPTQGGHSDAADKITIVWGKPGSQPRVKFW